MTLTGCDLVQDKVAGKAPETKLRDEERHEMLMSALPMLIVFAMWLVAQVWLMGPLLFR